MKDVWGPMNDWRTFDIATAGKSLKEFKAAWYKLYQSEGISTDLIVNFKNGERKLMSSNIYWGKIRNPENYRYYIGGLPVGEIFSQIKSIEAMHPLRNHPLCAEFWNKDETGAYCSFSFSKAFPTMDKIRDDLVQGPERGRASLDEKIRLAAAKVNPREIDGSREKQEIGH